jgi:hypothetical protein
MTIIGRGADGATGITNATALGYRATVTQSNSLVLGSINGVNSATANTNVGIGTTAPKQPLDVASGDAYISKRGSGLILKSSGGTCARLVINDAGTLGTIVGTCP